MPPALSIDLLLRQSQDLLSNHPYLEILLQLINLLPILLLAAYESLLAPSDVVFNLVVLIEHLLGLLNDLGEALVPVRGLSVLVRFCLI